MGELPIRKTPLAQRPIEIILNNDGLYAHGEVKIYGHVLNPADFTIDAEKGLLVLRYHMHHVRMKVENGD
jgi:hypothetical protein